MPEDLEITLAPERLDHGPPEERVCFGQLSIRGTAGPLTAGIDWFINSYRDGPLVSGYHIAEWMAWNWWRLCHEPRTRALDWWRAHRMTAIGEGYVWPNITIASDGARTLLVSDPSTRPDAKPFRYLGASPTVLPTALFESAVDAFVSQMEGRLIGSGLTGTNLSRIWADLRAERADPAEAERRRIEALLGRDPDDTEDDTVDILIADSAELGMEGVEELAADQGDGGKVLGLADLERLASGSGVPGRSLDVARLSGAAILPHWGEIPAWELGARAAEALRDQERLGDQAIGDEALADMAGVAGSALTSRQAASLAFARDEEDGTSTVVLRSRNRMGRRFELARLIGDRVVRPVNARFRPATRAYTYRQKMQRSFAAELLCPFPGLDAFLEDDTSPEAQQEAADHFQVSEWTVRALLVNHNKSDREELTRDLDLTA